MPARKKQSIFISHSSLDKKLAEGIYQALTSRFNLSCWMDNFDLYTGKGSFSGQIVDALQNSNLLLLVDSPAARASDYVKRELQTAKDLQIPIRRYSMMKDQSAFWRGLKIQWLAITIQVRTARGFLMAGLLLFLLLAALAIAIFLLGTRVIPVLANGGLRNLPASFVKTPAEIATSIPSDPKLAAPFHFKPDAVLLQDDFIDPSYENTFDSQSMTYDIQPRNLQIKVRQQSGSLVFAFPLECLREENTWECELELESGILDARTIHYFGIRARTLARTSLRGISVSISINEPNRSRAGFGWDFSDHAMAFFRSIPALPERELYAYVAIDSGWHAYEILRDPNSNAYHYYVDGQLVDNYTLVHAREWDQAPLRLIIYSLIAQNELNGEETVTQFEMDEVLIGGFTNK